MISGKTKLYGVMGWPIGHTLSPVIHWEFARAMGIDMEYMAFSVEPDQVEAAVKGAYALGIRGMNVTVPHKQTVIPFLDGLDKGAQVVGAVNTLVRTDKGYRGYNTDVTGLSRSMAEAGMTARDRVCILVGAGGAAKAAAYVLAEEGAAKVYALNRTIAHAEVLAGDLNRLFGREIIVPMALDGWRDIPDTGCLAVQTTSVGMAPKGEEAPIEDVEFYKKLDMAFDVIYTPWLSTFLMQAATAGAKVSNGSDMLVYQAAAAFELWNPGLKLSGEAIANAKMAIMAARGSAS